MTHRTSGEYVIQDEIKGRSKREDVADVKELSEN